MGLDVLIGYVLWLSFASLCWHYGGRLLDQSPGYFQPRVVLAILISVVGMAGVASWVWFALPDVWEEISYRLRGSLDVVVVKGKQAQWIAPSQIALIVFTTVGTFAFLRPGFRRWFWATTLGLWLVSLCTHLSKLIIKLLKACQFVEKRVYPVARRLEVYGIILALIAFSIDYADRLDERQERERQRIVDAWQILAQRSPGEGGKVDALETLHAHGRQLSFIDLSVDDGDGVLLRSLKLADADLSHVNFPRADLREAFLPRAVLHRANLEGAVLVNADLSAAHLTSAVLDEADLRCSFLIAADLSGASMRDADFSSAVFPFMKLRHADLSGAKFRRASAPMQREFGNCNGSSFPETVNLDQFEFSSFPLDQEQLNEACGDERTELEEGLVVPLCSDVVWYESVHGHRKITAATVVRD